MNTALLYEILHETTQSFRKGEALQERDQGPLHVIDVNFSPPVDEALPSLELVDVHFEVIGVDKARAEARKSELIGILDDWPGDTLAGGPSYITVGAEIGSQEGALQLFALGQVLDLWNVITPATLHLEGEDADRAAGSGYLFMSGYGWGYPKRGAS